jgi:hypothetical protein
MNTNQCIICFEDVDVHPISEILLKQPIFKPCECVYNIHEACIVTWVRNKPTCLYCKEQLYLEHNIVAQQSISINSLTKDDYIEHGDTTIIYTTNVEKNMCIRQILMCICIIMLILFIGNVLFN